MTGNSNCGISFNGSSNDNLVYNNYFNNTYNTRVSTDSTGNIWNINPTPGTNIVGGQFIGGNYWANPDSTGWSQVHYDIGNGFTDPYVVSSGTSSLSLYQGVVTGCAERRPVPADPQRSGPGPGSFAIRLFRRDHPAIPANTALRCDFYGQ